MRQLAILSVLCLSASVFAGDASKDMALDPDKAVADFKVQGEYSGELDRGNKKDKFGVQVIALGGGTFRAVLLNGGLPGDGWTGSDRVEIDGKTTGDKTSFASADQKTTAVITGDELTGKTAVGEAFSVKKVSRQSPTLGAKPPEGAVVLFDGTSADAWENGKLDERKLLTCGTQTKQKFGDCTLHIEFYLPFKPYGRGQDRGNSGVYMQGRYEVQVLDSFGLKGLDNECGGIYSKHSPLMNMCYPPLTWQTYDIEFTAPRYNKDGKIFEQAVMTVKHNGVVVHQDFKVNGATPSGKPEAEGPGPLYLQDHGNPVYYRNIWLVEKK